MKFLVILAILVGMVPAFTLAQSPTPPTFIQAQDAHTTSGDTLNVAFPRPTASGNLLVAYVLWSNTDSVTLSDRKNNVYTSGVGPTAWQANGANAQVFYATSVAGGSNTVTATFATPVTASASLYVQEYSGVDPTNPIDAVTAASGTGDTLNSGSLTTSVANDVLFAAGGSNMVIAALAGPYVARATTNGNLTADTIVDATGTYDVRATQTGTEWVMQLVALRGAAGAVQPSPTATPTSAPAATPTPTFVPVPTQTPAPAAAPSPPLVTPRQAAFPLKLSANHRYLVDQNNAPFLMVGDSPQAMIGDLSESDAELFLANRQAAGFNAEWINLLCNNYTACSPDGSTYDGVHPFTTPGDLSTPNEAYFSKVDRVLRLAANHSQLVMLDPIETGGWTGVATGNGTSKAYNYGKFLGLRYKNNPNILWMSGNDFQSWRTGDDAAIRAVAQGIKDNDPNHLQTIELDYQKSGSLDDSSWAPLLGLDAAYTYFPTYDQVLKEYNRASIPVFMVEANYEGEHNANDQSTPQILRRQEYWTLLSGATGQLYGNRFTWQFINGWKSNMDSPGSVQMKYVTALFTPRQWYDLVPDQSHTLVTGGYGTYSASSSLGSNDYLTAASTLDGTLALAYMPTVRTLTVDLSRLAGSVSARWYDPTRGTYAGVSGSPFANAGTMQFTPPGNNADGDGDWVLVLETGPVTGGQPVAPANQPLAAPTALPLPPPPPPNSPAVAAAPATTNSAATFVQVNSAVPQSPQASVGVTYQLAQSVGDTNVLAIGWNDGSSTINSVSDSAGNTYRVAAPIARGTGLSQAIYYARNINASSSNTVTVTFSGPVPFADVRILEYSGLDKLNPFDATASDSGSGPIASSGNATTSSATGLIVGAGMTNGGFGGPDSQFVSRIITSPDGDIVEDRTVSAAGSYAATAPVNDTWVMQMAAFR